jgi:hypothetical protein
MLETSDAGGGQRARHVLQKRESPMKRYGAAVWLILLAAVVCMVAGLLPLFRGGAIHTTFVALGVFWLIVAIASGASARKRAASDAERTP